jgi:tetratricopeptide (TPR) repeat protein
MENTPIKPEAKAPESTRSEKIKLVLYPAIVVVLGVIVFFALARIRPGMNPSTSPGGIFMEKDPAISEEEKQSLEAQVKNLETQIKDLPENAEVGQRYKLYRQLAGAKYRLGKYSEAISALDKIASENQNNSAMWSLYTIIYADMGDLGKARGTARRAADTDKANPNNWLAYIELSTEQDVKTLDDIYQEALASADPPTDIVVDYAGFLEKTGNKDRAIQQWQRAGQLNPSGKASYDANIARLQNS